MRQSFLRTAAAATGIALAASAASAAEVSKVGITVGSLGNPYYAVTNGAIQDTAAKLTPGAEVTAVSADYDLGKQFNQIDNFIAAGTNIIMLNAVDPVGIQPAVDRAKAAGITVAAFDVTAKNVDVTVMTDNEEAGRQACQYIVDNLPGGKGDVIIVNGPPISAIVDRVNGCEKVFAAHPDIHVISRDQNGQASRDGGLAVTQSLLTQFPKVDAIFAINDPTAIGADLAASQLHRSEFFITSVDGSPDAIQVMKGGKSLIRATSAQAPYHMASEAYRYAVEIVGGKKPPQQTILLPPTLVTTANIQSYPGWAGK
ncbi:ABC transporter substrate-binding protein [Labrys monachus]|uniref:Ribose transport system substrate-binding protein n=1 Tax=Labrys monachus TaxID=217067 RepID=A0ABU0FLS7_9HYPH|nr:ABC transporter substrate-binding protein [Labrys monachus]MDQ0395554.1 ribose transport system substrate-binding protein [Labrys monachus]